jgi:hypothetical protein
MMKRTTRQTLSLSLAAVALVTLLAACGGGGTDVNGTYKDQTGTVSYVFKDGQASMSVAGIETALGEYEVKDGELLVNGAVLGTVNGNTITVNGVELKK